MTLELLFAALPSTVTPRVWVSIHSQMASGGWPPLLGCMIGVVDGGHQNCQERLESGHEAHVLAWALELSCWSSLSHLQVQPQGVSSVCSRFEMGMLPS